MRVGEARVGMKVMVKSGVFDRPAILKGKRVEATVMDVVGVYRGAANVVVVEREGKSVDVHVSWLEPEDGEANS